MVSIDRNHLLSWKTVTEVNNKGFEVQTSRNGINFDSLGFIPSKANLGVSTHEIKYLYNHVLPPIPTTTVYYRLKQGDIDGKFTYSKVVSLGTIGHHATLFPNPATDLIILNITPLDGYFFQIIDPQGRSFQRGQLKTNVIKVSELPRDPYLLQLRRNVDVTNIKFIKI